MFRKVQLNDGDLFVERIRIELGWRDSITPRLEQRKKEAGIADRNDILTIPDLIDFDEGRFQGRARLREFIELELGYE